MMRRREFITLLGGRGAARGARAAGGEEPSTASGTAVSRCSNPCVLGRQNYSISSSARTSSLGGISIPSALAVLRLITSSNLVGC
jgi:hypothetical protein